MNRIQHAKCHNFFIPLPLGIYLYVSYFAFLRVAVQYRFCHIAGEREAESFSKE